MDELKLTKEQIEKKFNLNWIELKKVDLVPKPKKIF